MNKLKIFSALTICAVLGLTQAAFAQTAVPGHALAEKLAWLQTNAQSNTGYTIEVNADESIGPHTLTYDGKNNIAITLRGAGANRAVSLASDGAMFIIRSGVTLILDSNITLQGRGDNNASLVRVHGGGTFIMNNGSAITGNGGGGVYVLDGTFAMNGGTISGNTAKGSGGGVYVWHNGTFTMSGGTISSNTARISGGGVYGIFTKTGGTIAGNAPDDVGQQE